MVILRQSSPLSRRTFAAGVVITPLIAGLAVRGVAAQEATPTATSVEETQQALNDYVTALLAGGDIGQYLTEDVVVTFMDIGLEVSGREAVADSLITLHTVQFDAQPELVNMVVGEGIAAVEAIFVGTHTGEFNGIPATGASVAVPYSGFILFEDGLVSEIHLYNFVTGLMAQLSGASTPASATPSGVTGGGAIPSHRAAGSHCGGGPELASSLRGVRQPM